MNALTPIKADWQEAQAERRARYAAAVTRMAKLAIEWADAPHSVFAKARFLDAAAHCIDSDLQEETENALRECGLDSEGFPLDSYGDRDLKADRVWVPVQ